jgi:hypothetical protein
VRQRLRAFVDRLHHGHKAFNRQGDGPVTPAVLEGLHPNMGGNRQLGAVIARVAVWTNGRVSVATRGSGIGSVIRHDATTSIVPVGRLLPMTATKSRAEKREKRAAIGRLRKRNADRE